MKRFQHLITCTALLSFAACASDPGAQHPEATSEPTGAATATPTADAVATDAPTAEATSTPTAAPAAKVTEAQRKKALELVAQIARFSVNAWERESDLGNGKYGHALCKDANPVPAKLPLGGEAITVDDKKEMSGDGKAGWSCLRFVLLEPTHFQYSYLTAAPWKGKGRATEPKAGGFQVCAEADFTPGGDTTLYCITGAPSDKTTVKLDTVQTFEE